MDLIFLFPLQMLRSVFSSARYCKVLRRFERFNEKATMFLRKILVKFIHDFGPFPLRRWWKSAERRDWLPSRRCCDAIGRRWSFSAHSAGSRFCASHGATSALWSPYRWECNLNDVIITWLNLMNNLNTSFLKVFCFSFACILKILNTNLQPEWPLKLRIRLTCLKVKKKI